MYRDQLFAIAIIILFAALSGYLFLEGQNYKSFAHRVVDEWVEREEYLVRLCQIDYNDALARERDKHIKDMNLYVYDVFEDINIVEDEQIVYPNDYNVPYAYDANNYKETKYTIIKGDGIKRNTLDSNGIVNQVRELQANEGG